MIRKAKKQDIPKVVSIYDKIHALEDCKKGCTGWVTGVYPVLQTAQEALEKGDLYVMEEEGLIVASARINQEQVPEYAEASWAEAAQAHEVMVLHTLVVDPDCSGHGYGKAFVEFYENFAREHHCPYLRMDTNEKNKPARSLYRKLGYREPDIVPCVFNGIPNVQLVCLEKKI